MKKYTNYKKIKILPNSIEKKILRGMSTMEIVLYVSIITLCIGILVRVMAGTFAVFVKTRSIQALTQAGSSGLERMTYIIRNSTSYSASGNSLGINPSIVSLDYTDQDGTPHVYKYTVTNSRLSEQIDGGTITYLNGPNQTITNFTVNTLTAGTYSGANITITLEDNRIVPARSATFTTTVLMRGAY
jgi:hypothetical protein